MAFTSGFHIERNQAAGVRRRIDAKTGHTIDLGIEPGVVVAKEADLRADTPDQVIEPLGFASRAYPARRGDRDFGQRPARADHPAQPSTWL